MSNLDEIQKLYAVKRECKIGDATLELKPLSLEDMGVMDMKEDAPMDEIARNATKMFALSLGISEEAAAKISFEFMEQLLKQVMEINNFNTDDAKTTGMQKFIEQKRELAKAKK